MTAGLGTGSRLPRYKRTPPARCALFLCDCTDRAGNERFSAYLALRVHVACVPHKEEASSNLNEVALLAQALEVGTTIHQFVTLKIVPFSFHFNNPARARSSTGLLLNADVNGCLGHGRKCGCGRWIGGFMYYEQIARPFECKFARVHIIADATIGRTAVLRRRIDSPIGRTGPGRRRAGRRASGQPKSRGRPGIGQGRHPGRGCRR